MNLETKLAIKTLLEIRDVHGCELEEMVKNGQMKEEDWMCVADMCYCRSCTAARALYNIRKINPGAETEAAKPEYEDFEI